MGMRYEGTNHGQRPLLKWLALKKRFRRTVMYRWRGRRGFQRAGRRIAVGKQKEEVGGNGECRNAGSNAGSAWDAEGRRGASSTKRRRRGELGFWCLCERATGCRIASLDRARTDAIRRIRRPETHRPSEVQSPSTVNGIPV